MRWVGCGATSAVRVRVVAVKEGGAWTAVCAVCTPSEVAQGPSQFGLRPSVLRWSRLDPIGTHVGVGSSDHGAGEEGRVVSHFGARGSGVGEIKAVGIAVKVSIRVWVGFAFVGS